MTARVLSQHGNVIAADFRPRKSLDVAITFKSETLYYDGTIMVTRTSAFLGDHPFLVLHFMGNLATGQIVNL